MIKIFIFPILLLFFIKGKSQDSVRLFYIGKFSTDISDSAITSVYDTGFLSQCEGIIYKGASVKLLFFKNGSQQEQLSITPEVFQQWGDSVMLDMKIPNQLYDSSDSIAIIPTHRFACKGLKSPELFGLGGEEQKTKNIKLKFVSYPAEAVVYLIPKILWERNPKLSAKDEVALSLYKVPSGITPVWSPVQEYVYVCLFKYGDQYRTVECSPTVKNPVDSVYVNFNVK